MSYHIIGTTERDYVEHDDQRARHGEDTQQYAALKAAHIEHHNVLHDLCESGRAVVDPRVYTRLMQNAEAASRPTVSPKPAPHGDKLQH